MSYSVHAICFSFIGMVIKSLINLIFSFGRISLVILILEVSSPLFMAIETPLPFKVLINKTMNF